MATKPWILLFSKVGQIIQLKYLTLVLEFRYQIGSNQVNGFILITNEYFFFKLNSSVKCFWIIVIFGQFWWSFLHVFSVFDIKKKKFLLICLFLSKLNYLIVNPINVFMAKHQIRILAPEIKLLGAIFAFWFQGIWKFFQHTYIHDPEPRFRCPVCPKKTHKVQNFKDHLVSFCFVLARN